MAYKLIVLWSHHKETRELPGERDNAKNNATCTQARKTTHSLDEQHQDVELRTGLTMEESLTIVEDRDEWRKYVHGVANSLIEDA